MVNGAGNPHADILIIGPGPGRHEEREGRPLGHVKNQVDYLMSLAGMDPLSVRFESITRCRPPRYHGQDDSPTAGEIKKCSSFLLEVITKIQATMIVTLGAPAWKWFNSEYTLGAFHGNSTIWTHPGTGDTTPVTPMYHPSSVTLQNPALAPVMIADWKYLGKVLIGEGKSAKAEYLKQRLETKWVQERAV